MLWWRKKERAPLLVGGFTDIGLTRTENQDAFGIFPPTQGTEDPVHLFIVADGMGGHQDGREASQLAVSGISTAFFEASGPIGTRLQAGYAYANERIQAYAQQHHSVSKMGTTCTTLALAQGQLYLAHVGDSRAYRFRNGSLQQLSRDHTLVAQLQEEGVITEEEAASHPRRNVLVRALGTMPEVEVDVIELGPVQSGETYLLCSDGLSRIQPAELKQIVQTLAPEEASKRLTERANEYGGHDNSTAVIVRFP
ncbi:MAG: PP2C family serine/threonine-protein phosphatase [Bacteroidota bacterium]